MKPLPFCNSYRILTRVFTFIVIWSAFGIPATALAHVLDYGASETQLVAAGDTLKLSTSVPLYATYDFVGTDWKPSFEGIFRGNLTVSQNGRICPFTLNHIENSSKPGHTIFTGSFECPRIVTDAKMLYIRNTLFAWEYKNYDDFVTISIGNNKTSLKFTPSETDYPKDTSVEDLRNFLGRFFAVAFSFIELGVMHILTGYDHILFLISIVLLLRSFRSVLILVTAFTVAHSITLLLASLHIIELSTRIVEPAIAATIAFMAIRDLRALRRPDPAAAAHQGDRWAVVFAFGLIHGLGFASALQETDIPQGLFIPSLISFNVGIELGQLLMLSLVFPLLWFIDTLRHRNRILMVISASILALALAWFLARVFIGADCAEFFGAVASQVVCI